MTDATPLAPIHTDDWTSVLIVVAHPDDAEYGISAAVKEWTNAGIKVSYLLLTSGEAGIQHRAPEEVGPLRAREQQAACAAVGVDDLTILDEPDGMLESSLRLRMHVARHVRRCQPDVVVTLNFDFEAFGGLNQPDHRVAGLAAVDGTRDASNPWVFRELADEGLEPWSTRGLLVANVSDPTHAIPVSEESVTAAVRSLSAHREYNDALPDTFPKPDPLVRGNLEGGGKAAGVPHALTVRAWDLGGLFPAPDEQGSAAS